MAFSRVKTVCSQIVNDSHRSHLSYCSDENKAGKSARGDSKDTAQFLYSWMPLILVAKQGSVAVCLTIEADRRKA